MTTPPIASTTSGSVRNLARATAATTAVLLTAGGLVTSKGAGMAVPDWPTTYGYNMFTFPISRWIGPIAFEHAHRLLGSLVGMLTVALAVAVWRCDSRRWMRTLAVVAVVAVAIQGVLGGLRVIENERVLALVHGSFAHSFFALMAVMALATTRLWSEALASPLDRERGRGVERLALATTVALYVQILLGARLRHLMGTVFVHLGGAVLVITLVVALRFRTHAASHQAPAARMASALLQLTWIQLVLGFLAYAAKFMAPVPELAPWPAVLLTVAHQVNGALVFATAVSTTVLVYRGLRGSASAAGEDVGSPAPASAGIGG